MRLIVVKFQRATTLMRWAIYPWLVIAVCSAINSNGDRLCNLQLASTALGIHHKNAMQWHHHSTQTIIIGCTIPYAVLSTQYSVLTLSSTIVPPNWPRLRSAMMDIVVVFTSHKHKHKHKHNPNVFIFILQHYHHHHWRCACGWVVDVGDWLCWRRMMTTTLIVMFVVVGLVGCYVWSQLLCGYEGYDSGR